MDGRFNHPFSNNNQEDSENGSDNSGELPFEASDVRLTTNSSLKRSRRSIQKRVVTVPIGGGDADGSSRIKADGAPPYDSWAWRKYGQKPIKGSPYPRGYYRCSSSKGCPARKQVERSRVDPTMLVITYACDHNHSGAPSRNPTAAASASAAVTNSNTATSTATAAAAAASTSPVESPIYATQTESEDRFTAAVDEYAWFSDVASTSETILVNSIENSIYGESDMAATAAVIFPMGEEDESLFADLGELPECSVVFQRGFLDQETGRRCILRAG